MSIHNPNHLRSTLSLHAPLTEHPSGVETESLTLLSMVGTLHANLPQIEQAIAGDATGRVDIGVEITQRERARRCKHRLASVQARIA